MTLRFAALEDVPALLAIYERYISTTITFEYVLPSREEFARRMRDVSQVYPYLVLEEGGSAHVRTLTQRLPAADVGCCSYAAE